MGFSNFILAIVSAMLSEGGSAALLVSSDYISIPVLGSSLSTEFQGLENRYLRYLRTRRQRFAYHAKR